MPANKAGSKAGGKKKQKQQTDDFESSLYITSLFELPPHGQAEQLLQATFDGKTAGFGLVEVEPQCEMPHDGLQAMGTIVALEDFSAEQLQLLEDNDHNYYGAVEKLVGQHVREARAEVDDADEFASEVTDTGITILKRSMDEGKFRVTRLHNDEITEGLLDTKRFIIGMFEKGSCSPGDIPHYLPFI